MAKRSQTFSESWYRVANESIRLRTGIAVHRQNYRGERWFVLENPFSNQFFRLRPAAWEFVARLGRGRTIDEVWKECLELFPEDAPGQGEVIRLLTQLYHANLLEYDLADDARQLFERTKKRRERELKARLMSIMFMRFPLLNPDRFLVRTLPLVGPFISRWGALLWIAVVGLAIKVAIDHSGALMNESQAILAPGNLFLLYIGLAITKTIHEFGHAYVCRKFGGEVHVMGIMLLIFTPIPYVDATSSWGFREKWKRVLVGAAGMIVEVFVAAIAVFVWANTAPGTLHNLAYNMIFVASVSTVLFNINPLLRFDGYYILSDLLEIPNLHQQAARQLKFVAKRWLFGLKDTPPATTNRRQGAWITVFGIASHIYRIVVFAGIILFVADRFLLLGVIMAVICLVGWIVVPLGMFTNYLASSPELDRQRGRAVAATLAFVGGILAFLQFVPFPHHFRAPGIVRSRERGSVLTEAPGAVEAVLAVDGAEVAAGDPLVRLRNDELDLQIELAEAKVRELEARILDAMESQTANLDPLRTALDTARENLRKFRDDRSNLVVRARIPGRWISPQIGEGVGRWLARGTSIGLVADPTALEFTATVRQEEADRLFTTDLPTAEVRIPGEAGRVVEVAHLTVIPAEQRVLPSPVLGWTAGGEMQTDARDPEGRRTTEPFFEVRAEIVDTEGATLLDGRSGKIRFRIGNTPLLPRWIRSLRQLLQKRYQV